MPLARAPNKDRMPGTLTPERGDAPIHRPHEGRYRNDAPMKEGATDLPAGLCEAPG
jgi:hypothetical protein